MNPRAVKDSDPRESARREATMRLAKSIKMMKEVVDKDLAKSMRDDVSTFDVSPATTEELAKISERYVHLMSVLAAMREQSEKLAELADALAMPHVGNVVDRKSSEHFKRAAKLSDLFSDMYDSSINLGLSRPASGIRGVMEDRMNIENYFSHAVNEAISVARK
ncbi:hypothetical protein Ga0058931_2625 [Roseibaca calidilacus]|uniref:Uncharacterized protein n=1 Tax=Roseibaca calidilacus TaxID=1666912 RepID=A0ABP2BYS8_9RHOB|nr:hypothetical protein Ga0058931_2625 [Roseibaca calidilacus]